MAGGEYPQFRAALAFIDQNVKAGMNNEDDLRTRAVILSSRPYRSTRREAINVYEEIRKQKPLTSEDRFSLAQLYEANHEWPKAQDLLVGLISEQPANAIFQVRYAAGLLRNNDYQRAGVLIAKLEQSYPDAWLTLELRCRLLEKQNKAIEAETLLRAYADKPNADLRSAGLLLEDLKRPRAAEDLLQKFISLPKQAPEINLIMAQFLARQKRVSDAMDICDRAWRTCSPEFAGTATIAVLYFAKAGEKECQRMEHWFQEALTKKPESATFYLQMGDLRSFQERYQDAEAYYRQALQRDPKQRYALNNLAWLLAFRESKSAEAMEMAQRSFELLGPIPEVLDTRGIVLLHQGNPDAALKDLEDAVDVPTAARFFHLAQARLAANDKPGAREALAKAKELGLAPAELHGLERQDYQRLLADLTGE